MNDHDLKEAQRQADKLMDEYLGVVHGIELKGYDYLPEYGRIDGVVIRESSSLRKI